MLNYLIIVIIGIVGGTLAGLLGTTTATTTLPALLLFNLVPNFNTAVGTTLLSILPPLSIFAAYEYYLRNEINFTYAFILIFVCTIFAWVGAEIQPYFTEKSLKFLLASYLILVACYLIYSAYNTKN